MALMVSLRAARRIRGAKYLEVGGGWFGSDSPGNIIFVNDSIELSGTIDRTGHLTSEGEASSPWPSPMARTLSPKARCCSCY